MRALAIAWFLASLCACGWIGFEKSKTVQAVSLEASVRAYYDEVVRAFMAGDAQALTMLFAPTIAKPMTRPQIQAWGEKFFGEHGGATFVIEKIEFDELGPRDAVVRLAYKVKTKSGKGEFGGVERDVLHRDDGAKRWTMTSWEKLPL